MEGEAAARRGGGATAAMKVGLAGMALAAAAVVGGVSAVTAGLVVRDDHRRAAKEAAERALPPPDPKAQARGLQLALRGLAVSTAVCTAAAGLGLLLAGQAGIRPRTEVEVSPKQAGELMRTSREELKAWFWSDDKDGGRGAAGGEGTGEKP